MNLKARKAISFIDKTTQTIGSLRFILAQFVLIIFWIVYNLTTQTIDIKFGLDLKPFDPFPFVILNLLLSFQAALIAPIILSSQIRAASVDSKRIEADLNVNVLAEQEIRDLRKQIEQLKQKQSNNHKR